MLPEFESRVDAPVWKDLIDLATQLDGFPKYLGQHPGGMIISSTPLTDMVPVQPAAMVGRYICQWDKDAIDSAGCVKIDFLSLGTLSHLQDILQMVEERTGTYIDLSRIDHQDPNLYAMLHRGDTIGVFQVESPAQMHHTITRLKPANLIDMAYEVAAVRPGVGANDGVSQFIARRTHPEIPWEYDHPLEELALGHTYGVVLYQDQLNKLAIHVAGFSPGKADRLRRAFSKKNNIPLIAHYWQEFKEGAMKRGVSEEAAKRIFKKFNGHYMFPEAHAYAFGITAYHMAYLKLNYPLEFYVAIFNQQPMGFYSLETLKEDARRHGIHVLNPDINISIEKCTIHNESLLLGLTQVRSIGKKVAEAIVEARNQGGPFESLADAMQRTGLKRRAIENLIYAGAFDSMISHRAAALWEVGLRYRPASLQLPLPLSVEQDMTPLAAPTSWQNMNQEYYSLGLSPGDTSWRRSGLIWIGAS
jgi:error-prone DNA polymerase